MALQQKIPILPSPAIASYDYFDISDGTGIRTFYFYQNQDNLGLYSGLTTDHLVYSSSIADAKTSSGSTSYDFDLSAFNTPKTIKGTALFQACTKANSSGGYYTSFDVTIKKVSGANVSTIATATTENASYSAHTFCLKIDVPQTNFKPKDILRVNVVWHYTIGGGNYMEWGHDPANRDGQQVTAANGLFTASFIKIPFKLNI